MRLGNSSRSRLRGRSVSGCCHRRISCGGSGPSFGPIRDRWYFGAKIQNRFADFGPLDRSDLVVARAQDKPDRYQTALNSQPSIFFSSHRVGSVFGDRADYWARWLALESDGQNSLNMTILRHRSCG